MKKLPGLLIALFTLILTYIYPIIVAKLLFGAVMAILSFNLFGKE